MASQSMLLCWSKAFDKVPLVRLLSKLQYYGYPQPRSQMRDPGNEVRLSVVPSLRWPNKVFARALFLFLLLFYFITYITALTVITIIQKRKLLTIQPLRYKQLHYSTYNTVPRLITKLFKTNYPADFHYFP